MKNQKVILPILIIGLIALVGGGYFVLSSKKEAPKPVISWPQQQVEETVKSLSPEDIGLTLTITPDNKKAILQIEKIDDILSLEYELTYNSKGNISRGATGNINIKTQEKIAKQEIVLGTCSDVCHYDQDVSGFKVIAKVTKTDNKEYLVEKAL